MSGGFSLFRNLKQNFQIAYSIAFLPVSSKRLRPALLAAGRSPELGAAGHGHVISHSDDHSYSQCRATALPGMESLSYDTFWTPGLGRWVRLSGWE